MANNPNQNPSRKGLTKQTMAGFFWQTSGTAIAAICQFVVMVVLTRLLTPTEFGLINIAYTVTVFADILNQFGLAPSLIQRKTLTEKHIRSAFTFTNLVGISMTIILWVLAPFIANFFNDAQGLTGILRGLSLLYITNSIGTVSRALNYRNLNYRIKSMFAIVSYVVGYGVVGIGMAVLGYGTWALVGAALVQSALLNLLFLRVSPHDFRPLLDISSLSDLLGFGAGVTLGAIFQRAASNVDNIIVGKALGTAEVGVYSRAFQLMQLPNKYFGNILQSVLFTAMARVQDEPKTLRAVYRRGVAMIAALTMPLSMLLLVFAPETIHTLFGEKWDGAIIPFQIFAGTIVFRMTVRMSDVLSKSSGAVYKRAWYQFIYALLATAGAWIGHFWGVNGVAAGVTVAALINFYSMTRLSLSITQMTRGELMRIYLPSGLLAVVILLESWLLALLLRSLALPDFVTLGLASAIVILTSLGLFRFAPKTFLGPEGEWIVKTLVNHLPAPVKRRFVRLGARG
jgi:lipopolysaccharide exporter